MTQEHKQEVKAAPAEVKPVAPKAAKAQAKIEVKAEPVKSGPVKVRSRVNMQCLDGTHLVVGEASELSRHEYARLVADKRGPFFEEI